MTRSCAALSLLHAHAHAHTRLLSTLAVFATSRREKERLDYERLLERRLRQVAERLRIERDADPAPASVAATAVAAA